MPTTTIQIDPLFDPAVLATEENEAYINTRDLERNAQVRLHCESLWQRYSHLADSHFRMEFQRDMCSRYWEMYLGCSILDLGLTPSSDDAGPDLTVPVNGQTICIEAVAPTPGQVGLPDSVPDYECGKVRSVPDNQLVLRILSAIRDKGEKYHEYVRSGLVSNDASFMIAVSGSKLPSARQEVTVPRIVRSVLPVGDEYIRFDLKSGQFTDSGHQYRNQVMKSRGQSIPTDLFLDPAYAWLSAVLWSCVDPWNVPPTIGADFIVVHNPLALHPLPHGFINVGSAYSAVVLQDGCRISSYSW